jgi:UDP-N-acetylglucosamine 2-epimerase
MKVMTVVGTRPELIKMACCIEQFDQTFEHILVHTGQNYDYELNQIFFKDLGIRQPDHFLECDTSTPASAIGDIITKIDQLIRIHKPDAFVVYGDTNSCLSVISAKRNKVPIFHFEAGNRCFDARVPEEINRKIVDHTSDINFVLSEHARRYLISEGFKPEQIFKVGSHLPELVEKQRVKIDNSTILESEGLLAAQYFLVSLHREENVDSDDNLQVLVNAVNKIALKYKHPVIFSVHPRTLNRLRDLNLVDSFSSLVRLLKPFSFSDYLQLQKSSLCVISDSGTVSEESSILKCRSITIRNAHERPEGVDAGVFITASLDVEHILDSIDLSLRLDPEDNEVSDYHNYKASADITKIIHSYTPYVKRVVWKA